MIGNFAVKLNKQTILVLLVILGVGGYWAYESYQEHQRMKTWDALMNDESCDTCAARKAGMTKNIEENKADATNDTEAQAQ